MTSTLTPAPTDRRLRGFATRRPEWFAVLISLAYVLPPLALWLLEPEQLAGVAGIAWMVLVPAALLTALGWWGTAGFTRRSTWRSLVPLLPLILLFVVLPLLTLVFGPEVPSHSPGYFILATVTTFAVGFGYEATFRGVVLQTLLPRGTMRAVLVSSVLYGAANIGTLAQGLDPVLVGVYVLFAVGMGVAFAAVVVVTGTIWPLVLINAATQILFYFLAEGDSVDAVIRETRPDVAFIVIDLVLAALAAGYGIRLLHRHQHRPSAHSSENDQFSPPQQSVQEGDIGRWDA